MHELFYRISYIEVPDGRRLAFGDSMTVTDPETFTEPVELTSTRGLRRVNK